MNFTKQLTENNQRYFRAAYLLRHYIFFLRYKNYQSQYLMIFFLQFFVLYPKRT